MAKFSIVQVSHFFFLTRFSDTEPGKFENMSSTVKSESG